MVVVEEVKKVNVSWRCARQPTSGPGYAEASNPRRAGGNFEQPVLTPLRRMATVAMPSSTLTTRQMPDEHYSSASWDYVDNASGASPTASYASHSITGRPSMSTPAREQGSSRGSPNTDTSPPPPTAPSKSGSPPPRLSVESLSKSSAAPSRWRESVSTLERQNTISSTVGEPVQLVEPSFDENVLRALCDMDVRISLLYCIYTTNATATFSAAFLYSWTESSKVWCPVEYGNCYPLPLRRISNLHQHIQEASVFFKKRAVLEEEYGRSMQKLSKMTSEVYSMNDGKAGYAMTSYIGVVGLLPTALLSMRGNQL